jgi:hypothetical protein
MTVIAVYTSEGCVGRCDAKCYAAQEPECTGVCGGSNQGAGVAQAIENTRQSAEAWIETSAGAHTRAECRAELGQAVEPLPLF